MLYPANQAVGRLGNLGVWLQRVLLATKFRVPRPYGPLVGGKQVNEGCADLVPLLCDLCWMHFTTAAATRPCYSCLMLDPAYEELHSLDLAQSMA